MESSLRTYLPKTKANIAATSAAINKVGVPTSRALAVSLYALLNVYPARMQMIVPGRKNTSHTMYTPATTSGP